MSFAVLTIPLWPVALPLVYQTYKQKMIRAAFLAKKPGIFV